MKSRIQSEGFVTTIRALPTMAEDKPAEEAKTPDDSNLKRKKDTELVVPICYGTCAYWLGKKADEYHSHKWTVYLRGPEYRGGPLARHLEGAFNLHPSFKEAQRTLEKPPYEVTETGWGEFEIGITVHFSDDSGEKIRRSLPHSSSTRRARTASRKRRNRRSR